MSILENEVQELFDFYDEKRYQDTKDLLSSLSHKDINNYHIYYFKAICCIHMLQFDEALMNLGEASYLYPDYVPSMHALAYIFLKRGDFESAMNKWLAIKTIAPKDSLVGHILQKVKSGQLKKDPSNRYAIDDFIQLDFKELRKGFLFFSPMKKLEEKKTELKTPSLSTILKEEKNAKKKKLFPIKGLVLALVIVFVALYIISFLFLKKSPPAFDLSSSKNGLVLFSFLSSEIEEKQKNLKESLKEKNYNKSMIQINELLYSNAPDKVKKEAFLARRTMTKPENPNEIGESVSLSTILKNPALYQGVFLSLSGSVSNFLKHPQYLTFDLSSSSNPKISNIYFTDTQKEDLPFDNQDELSIFGYFHLDENNNPIIEDTQISLQKTATSEMG